MYTFPTHKSINPFYIHSIFNLARIVSSLFFLSLLITFSISPVTAQAAQACSTHQFPDHKTSFAACNDLPVLNSTIYWSYFPSNGTVDLAFKATLLGESRWTAWAINPSSKGMVGSQALVAFQRTDGSMAAYTSPIKRYDTRLEQGNLTFPIYTLSAVYENNEITIFASLGLPNNVTTVNQIWQQGPLHGNTPGMHPMSGPYLKSYGTLDFLSGKVETTSTHAHSWVYPLKIFHGIINMVSWGILFPVGAIAARSFKAFGPKAWFTIHQYCQYTGFAVGLVGWGTGLFFPFMSHGIQHKGHFCIGTTLLVLVIAQVLLGVFRADKEGKYRWLWKLFHFCVGYTTIILGIVNVFKGFAIWEDLGVSNWYKYGYVGLLTAMAIGGIMGAGYKYWKDMKTQAAEKQLEQRADGNV